MRPNLRIRQIISNALAIAIFILLSTPVSVLATDHGGAPVTSGAPAGKKDSGTSSQTPEDQSAADQGSTVFSGTNIDDLMVTAKILSVGESIVNQELLKNTGMTSIQQKVRLKVLEGPMAGKEFEINHEMSDNPAFTIEVKPGQEVLVSVSTNKDGQVEVSVADYYRAPVLYGLLGIFLVAFLAFGGKQGVKSLLGLVATVLLIGYILLPMSLKGFDPLWTSVVIGLTACATSILLVGGLSKKSLSAVIGTVGGVIIAGVAAELVINLAPLTGLSSEEAQILRGSVLIQEPPFYRGLLAAGMLIGALGVIMDVGISIASSVHEVSKADKNLTTSQLYTAGMNVGRDIMGTMTNTLILAYTGSALPLLLLATQMPTVKLINLDLFATEVASAFSGSLGLSIHDPFNGNRSSEVDVTKTTMRVVAGLILFGCCVASVLMGGLVFPAAFGFACYFGGNEFIKMVQKKGVKPSVRIVRGMIIAFFVITALPYVPVISPLVQTPGGPPSGFPVINYQVDQEFPLQHFPLLLTVGIFISFFRLLFRGKEKNRATIVDIASTILGFIYVGWMPAHIVLLRNLSHPSINLAQTPPLQHPGLAYVWVTLFIIWATDIFAYVFGKRFGKTKLMEDVSPKKTWEGAFWGLALAVFCAGLVVWVADNFLFESTKPFGTHGLNIFTDAKFWIAPAMGACVSVAGQLGDLCESLIKRDAGLKDSSDAIPGHGGVLDRGDSILFGAPISYYWIKIFFLGIW